MSGAGWVAGEDPSGSAAPVAVLVILSGRLRGTTLRLAGERLRIGSARGSEIRLSPVDHGVAERHATLERLGDGYEVVSRDGQLLWVNGERQERRALASGDLLEIGRGGPLLRFRLFPAGSPAYKSVGEALGDCLDCARHGAGSLPGRAAVLLAGAPHEMATQTAPWFRVTVVLALALLVATTVGLAIQGRRLERRLAAETGRLNEIAMRVETARSEGLQPKELTAIRTELADRLGETGDRLTALEARSEAYPRVIAQVSRSVIFLQGAYGFVEPESRRVLRLAEPGPDGRPRRGADGQPLLTLEGQGPPYELLYTGTAFVASPDGLLITNRHVALPWEYDDAARALRDLGLAPVMRRFVGYLPGLEEAFEVTLVAASDEADVALLRCDGATGRVPHLELATATPEPGEEVLVLGYPTGMRALLARAERDLVARLLDSNRADFWSLATGLAAHGQIRPLASRGIVAQVAPAAVVYDAETTQGGSGGPVVDLDGRVVAVNAAILPEFGGSNLGIPASFGRALIESGGAAAD